MTSPVFGVDPFIVNALLFTVCLVVCSALFARALELLSGHVPSEEPRR